MITLGQSQLRRLNLVALSLAPVLAVACAHATIRGPYAPDANTVILLHLDEEASTGIAVNAVPGGASFIATANPSSQAVRYPQPGILGAPGPVGLGYDFGRCADLSYSNSMALFMDANGNGQADLDTTSARGADQIPMSALAGPSGEFTLEALIKLPSLTGANREIISMDNTGSPRPFQFRVTATGQLEFNNIGTAGANPKADIPTTGPDAFVANEWFHVAMTYDGAGTIKFYWTRLDPARTNATLLQTFTGIPVLNESGSAVLTIGNENRNTSGEGLLGYIDEVRISNIAREATDMIFEPIAAPMAPSISPQPTNQWVGVGELLTIQAYASGSPPLSYQWQKNSGTGWTNIPDQTTDLLSLPVTFETEGDYRYIVSNPYGSATSDVARVTVGALFSGLFRTGFDDAYVQLPDGAVDPHYTLWVSADPANLGPNTLATPITDNNYNANDARSRWITPYPTLGGVRGVFTYRTTFLLDSALPEGALLSGAILSAGPTVILLNGQPTGVANLNPPFPGPFRNLFWFTLTNGFVPGLNTLDFQVDNSPTAVNSIYGTALRVTELRGIGHPLPPGPPVILSQPESHTVREGGKVTFAVVALGRPPLRYQWFGDGWPVDGATNRTLTFEHVSWVNQFFELFVVVSNDFGQVQSQTAELTVVPDNQPVITTNLHLATYRGVPLAIAMSTLVQHSVDPDGDPISVLSYDAVGSHPESPGAIWAVGAMLIYSNTTEFVGLDSFNVVLTDGLGGHAVNTVNVEVLPEPRLGLARQPEGTLRLAWPALATAQGFRLQSAELVTGPFVDVPDGAVQTEGSENVLYVAPTGAARFYRLARP